MTDSKHTPHPWRARISHTSFGESGAWIVERDTDTEERTLVCKMPYSSATASTGKRHVADAHLIAAAPELLSCLRELLALHEAHHNHPAHAAARAAIKKAAPDQFPINKPNPCSGRDNPGQEGAKSNHDQ